MVTSVLVLQQGQRRKSVFTGSLAVYTNADVGRPTNSNSAGEGIAKFCRTSNRVVASPNPETGGIMGGLFYIVFYINVCVMKTDWLCAIGIFTIVRVQILGIN